MSFNVSGDRVRLPDLQIHVGPWVLIPLNSVPPTTIPLSHLECLLMRAMILSAGYGTRLWPLTEDRTKPAIPILGKPLVGYVAEYLAGYGCDEIVVNLHHRPESVRAALGDGSKFGVKLHYVEEPVILGTSGAFDNAREIFEGETLSSSTERSSPTSI